MGTDLLTTRLSRRLPERQTAYQSLWMRPVEPGDYEWCPDQLVWDLPCEVGGGCGEIDRFVDECHDECYTATWLIFGVVNGQMRSIALCDVHTAAACRWLRIEMPEELEEW